MMTGLPLSIDEQVFSMRAVWPRFVVKRTGKFRQFACWSGEASPQFSKFTLEVRYQLGDWPQVRILAPTLVRLPGNEEGQLPHVYPPSDDPTLCLFDPVAGEWDASMPIAQTIVLWAFDWIACYELWLMTGKWAGGGRHVGRPSATLDLERAQ